LAPKGRAAAKARAAAAQAVHEVERGASLDAALERAAAGLPPDQRGLLGELAYGTCRWYHRLSALADLLLDRPFRPKDRVLFPLVLVGLYQLLYTRVPSHAAVAEPVQGAKELGKPQGAGLLNAVLRRFQREEAELLARADGRDAARYGYPEWLFAAVRAAWPEHWQQVIDAGNQRPPMTLRVNLSRITRTQYAASLAAEGITARPSASIPSALVLDRPLPVDRLPGFSDGLVSVQDAAAQFAASLLGARAGDRVLDACAAPGGKTAHIAESTPEIGALTAVDVDPERLRRVTENLQRLGLHADLLAADASDPAVWASSPGYDRILVDAPCSATGVIRRHPDIKLLRRAADVPALVEKQRSLMAALWPLLRPGGILLYCTCSVLPEENAMQLGAFSEMFPDAVFQPLSLPVGRASGGGWQIVPGDADTDGFFYARLEKART